MVHGRLLGSRIVVVIFLLGVLPFLIHDSSDANIVPPPVTLLKSKVEHVGKQHTEQFVISFKPHKVDDFRKRNNHTNLAPVTWISGVDGYHQGNLDLWAELTNHRFEPVNASLFGRSQEDKDKHGSPHAIGCYLAHWHLVRMLNDRPPQLRPELYFMFEDDSWCIPDLKLRVLQLTKQLPSDWDMLFIGGKPITNFKRIPSTPESLHQEICRGALGKGDSPLAPDGSRNLSVTQPYWKTKFITNTDAYVINPQRIDRVVDVLDPKKLRTLLAIDDTLGHAMAASQINVFMTTQKWCSSLDHIHMYSDANMNKPVPWTPSFFNFVNEEGERKHFLQDEIHIENCSY